MFQADEFSSLEGPPLFSSVEGDEGRAVERGEFDGMEG